jgi:hypothetical protein
VTEARQRKFEFIDLLAMAREREREIKAITRATESLLPFERIEEGEREREREREKRGQTRQRGEKAHERAIETTTTAITAEIDTMAALDEDEHVDTVAGHFERQSATGVPGAQKPTTSAHGAGGA